MISLPGGEFEEREVKGWIIFTAMWAYEVSDSGLCERHTTRPQYHFRISGLKMQISFYDFHFIISFGLGGATSINRICSIRGAKIADRAIMNSDPPTCKN